MVGGLYGDLPPPSSSIGDDDGESGNAASSSSLWSSSAKMAPSALRKPSMFAPPQSVLRGQGSGKAKPVTAVRSFSSGGSGGLGLPPRWGDVRQTSPPLPPPPPATIVPLSSSSAAAAFVGVSAAVADEYDPAKPNDYEEYCRERRRRKVEDEIRREMERHRQEEEEEREKREVLRMSSSTQDLERERERDRDRDRDRDREPGDGAKPRAATPTAASLHISGEEAWKRRALLSGARGSAAEPATPARARSPSPQMEEEGFTMANPGGGLGLGSGGQMTAAQRMMAKMGWKEGQGLGKQEQGITTPLMAKKTDKRAGVIVNASESKPDRRLLPGPPQLTAGTPSRVILLKNMVGPGEVDDELEEEVASECTKYGNVLRVLIFEITEPGFPASEAVRIFVQFEHSDQGGKAIADLDGRYFGGRTVRANFYDEDRFGVNDLVHGLEEAAAP